MLNGSDCRRTGHAARAKKINVLDPSDRERDHLIACSGREAWSPLLSPLTKSARMPYPWLSNLRGDIVGGLVSAAVAIPLAMGFGMFAFVSLGDEFFAAGALAGLCSAFVLGTAMVAFGSKTTTVYAPRVNTTFVIGLLLHGLINSDIEMLRSGGSALFAVTFLSIMLAAGAFQALFGLVGLGTLIKFTPHPVMAGFQNAAALLLFLVQLGNVLGFDKHVPFTVIAHHLASSKPLSILVAATTFVAMWNSRRIAPGVPPLLVGLAVGTALYYGFAASGLAAHLGSTIGAASFTFSPLAATADVATSDLFAVVPTIVSGALALAIVASIDALLCARLVAQPGAPKPEGNALLLRLGIGNMLAACFGGITSGLNIGGSIANRTFGARTPLSVLVNAAVIAATFAVLFPFVAYLPRVALSAVIMVVAVQHIDPWSKQIFRRLVSGSNRARRALALELIVVLLVTCLSVAVNIVLAVFLGVAIAVALFVVRMGRSSVRRMYRGDSVHSRKSRSAADMELLEQRGSAIAVMELQGALFFGSAERLANQIDATCLDTHYLVLDLKRVTEIDSTGAEILLQIQADRLRAGEHVAVSLFRDSTTAVRLVELGVLDGIDKVFDDVDQAIEWAEEDLLRKALGERAAAMEIPLCQVDILSDFTDEEIAVLAVHLTRVVHEKGDFVFRQGDPGKQLFVITRGTASVYLHPPDGAHIRLVTFARGATFGELSILDAGPRSASVVADEMLVCYCLSEQGFAGLSAHSSALAIKLLVGLGRELSGRLRRANTMIYQLEA
jgi:SulP family sulfate permease